MQPGRYVFAPPGTPHFEEWHNFGSRDWTTDEEGQAEAFGEVRDARRKWSRGDAPIPYTQCSEVCAEASLCPWTLEAEGGASWDLEEDVPTWTAENSLNCGGTNDVRQKGKATRRLYTSTVRQCTVVLDFAVETQNSGFDTCNVLLDDSIVLQIGGLSDGGGCTMYSSSVTDTFEIGVGPHTIMVVCDTVDNLYHVDCHFRATFTFDPPFPPSCLPDAASSPWLDVLDRTDDIFLARAMDLLYNDVGNLETFLRKRFGDTAAITTVPNSAAVVPGTSILTLDGSTLVVIAGTTTGQQLAAQMCYLGTGPINFGAYSTNLIWHASALAVNGRINASASDPTKPIVFAGHSYGGALACLLAATYKMFRPDRYVQLATFGSPRAGDFRLVTLLDPVRRIHFANRGDFVTSIPPTILEMGFLVATVPLLLLSQWVIVSPMGEQTILEESGEAVASNATVLTLTDTIQALADLIPGNPLPPFAAHFITEYLRRLNTRL